MSMIPGTVGAAPVQNIGAYGQELSQVVESVRAYDTKSGEIVTLTKPEMKMGYRTTRFNTGEDVGRFFIISVTLKLRRGELEPPFYNSLQRYIDEHGRIVNKDPFSYGDLLTLFELFNTPDEEKIRLLTL